MQVDYSEAQNAGEGLGASSASYTCIVVTMKRFCDSSEAEPFAAEQAIQAGDVVKALQISADRDRVLGEVYSCSLLI